RDGALGPRADPPSESVRALRQSGRAAVPRSRADGLAADRSRAAARPRVGEHARRADRARLPDESGAGEAAHQRRLPEPRRAGNLRRDRALPRHAHAANAEHAMISRRLLTIAAVAAVAIAVVALIWLRAPRLTSRATPRAAAAPSPTAPAPPGRKIKARLFYVADDGMRLTGVERDIAYGAGATEQARDILPPRVAPGMDPLVSAAPAGTAVRAVFLTEGGDASVDLSREVAAAHPGGPANELLTVYTIVNPPPVNLPAVTAVQLL